MGSTFLQAWDCIAKHEQELTLPILIHYSTIDKVTDPTLLNCQLIHCGNM